MNWYRRLVLYWQKRAEEERARETERKVMEVLRLQAEENRAKTTASWDLPLTRASASQIVCGRCGCTNADHRSQMYVRWSAAGPTATTRSYCVGWGGNCECDGWSAVLAVSLSEGLQRACALAASPGSVVVVAADGRSITVVTADGKATVVQVVEGQQP